MMKKQTSAKLAKLAGQVLKGYEPTREEIVSMAASVLAQRETALAEKKRAAAKNIAKDEAAAEAAAAVVVADEVAPVAAEASPEVVAEGLPTKPKGSWLSGLFGKASK